MANTKLLDLEIRNFAGGRSRRSHLPFGLIYRTSPEQLDKVVSLAKAAVESRKDCTFVRCAILRFGPSSIDYELIFDCRGTDVNKTRRRSHRRRASHFAIVRRARLQFAYPTQTTFTAAPDGTMIMPYAAVQPVVAMGIKSQAERAGVIAIASYLHGCK